MIRQHSAVPLFMPGPFFLAFLGAAFCVWSASGNALNLCFTSGCSLYQDLTIAGISMWWLGVIAFGVLALLSISGRTWLGVLMAGLCLLGDAALLLLMLCTAPCVGCLFVALIFALVYAAFRHVGTHSDNVRRSWLILLWSVLFIANVGAVIRAEVGTWAMHGPEEPAVRLYFSPSCSACREAVTSLSGRVNVGFYPVAENEEDLSAIAAMVDAVQQGASMADALSVAKAAKGWTFWQQNSPEMLLLRFRTLRNKAHVLAAGGEAVPFIEYQGLPVGLTQKAQEKQRNTGVVTPMRTPEDATLPVDTDIAGSCGGANTQPCP